MDQGLRQIVLHHVDELSVALIEQVTHHLKRIDGKAIFSGVNFGIQDAEARLVKVATNSGKEVLLIGCVDHHL